MAHPPLPENLTYREAAKLLNVSERHLRDLRARGELAAYRLGKGRSVRFKRSDIEGLLRRIPTVDPSA